MVRLTRKQIKEMHRKRGWGGKRPGSGRKPIGVEPRKRVALYIGADSFRILMEIRERGFSPARTFEHHLSDLAKALGIGTE